jgi:hypothetical protein
MVMVQEFMRFSNEKPSHQFEGLVSRYMYILSDKCFFIRYIDFSFHPLFDTLHAIHLCVNPGDLG